MRRLTDRYYQLTHFGQRVVLAAFGGSWFLLGLANVFVSTTYRWNPQYVALLAFLSSACSLLLALRPESVLAFRLGGTFAVGTLLFRIASVALGMWTTPDGPWLTMATIALAIMLLVLYGGWWLTEVKPWHERQKRVARDDAR